jgi:uncharacterized membrane protein YbhN (UPF0104 family)
MAVGVLVLGGIAVGLHGALKKIEPGDVLTALAVTPRQNLQHAVLLLGLSMCVMGGYDLPGVIFARRTAAFPRLGLLRIGLASFCAYALSHVLGAPALSAAAIRCRLYAQWKVPPSGIARIVTITGSTFTVGFLTTLGVLLLLNPLAVPVHAPPGSLRFMGAMLAGTAIAYVAASGQREFVTLLGRRIPLPGTRLAFTQILLSCADIAIASGILYALLPHAPGLTMLPVLGLYLAAFVSGVFSGLPGGVGVFDSVLLLGLSAYLPPATALGAILLFRVLYFMAPACLAAPLYAGHELWMQARSRRLRRS